MARILIIDDEEPFRKMLKQTLERAGYEVMDAPDGTIGTALYREKPTDLLITDMLMPEKDGIELIKELRRDFPDIKIIAMSGGGRSGNLDLLPAASVLGAHHTFMKPFNRQELLDAIRELVTAQK